jgi:signal transduction histidine kinase
METTIIRESRITPGRAERVRAIRAAALTAAGGLTSYFAFVWVVAARGWFAFDVGAVAPLFVGLITFNLALAATVPLWAVRRASMFWLYEGLTAVAVTAVMHELGGVAMGIFFIGYPLLVIHSQTMRPEASVFVTANLCVACYAALAWLEGTGRLPPPPVVAPLTGAQHAVVVVAALFTLNIFALYADQYGRQLRGLAARLRDRVARRTAELTAANAELARAYEELRTTQAQLLETEKRSSLGLLVSGVAHEINNPISLIIGNVEPLRASLAALDDVAGRERGDELGQEVGRVRRIAEMIARGAERTAGIVADLRLFSHLGDRAAQTFDVHEAIEVTLRLLRPRWTDRITIHRDFGRVPPVEAAAGEINQVLMNVLTNACDAVEAGGNVWITTRSDGTQLSVAIRDDGAGIAPEHVPRIFDPFFTTKPVGQGTGLGLAISRSIIDAHGGTITVTAGSGRGATFTITLPLTAARRRQDPAPVTRRAS